MDRPAHPHINVENEVQLGALGFDADQYNAACPEDTAARMGLRVLPRLDESAAAYAAALHDHRVARGRSIRHCPPADADRDAPGQQCRYEDAHDEAHGCLGVEMDI